MIIVIRVFDSKVWSAILKLDFRKKEEVCRKNSIGERF